VPLGYWIFAGLLCFGVLAAAILGERPGYPATWTKRIFAVLGTVNWIVALSILILRIP
jgi:hypothetical protein